MNRSCLRSWTVLSMLLVLGACESEEGARLRRDSGSAQTGPSLEVSFYEKFSRKTGKRSGRSDVFQIAEDASVRAFADFEGLAVDRDYTVHLAWIRPDGREMFRRYAEFRLAAADSGVTGLLLWKDATDLHKIRTREITGSDPAVSLDSRLRISPDRERDPGLYRFRVYLDRRLVREESFTLLDAET